MMVMMLEMKMSLGRESKSQSSNKKFQAKINSQ